ncbi:MAG: TauD/TfdA family dioxygenase [Pseudomonadales bacterium]|nr:TauD/TfdA family dioxygenase [Pseudomonadales bacterium]
MTLKITPLDAPLGAIVSGWQPSQALSTKHYASVKQALAQYHLLVFRGHQQPTDQQLVQFASKFGNLIKGSKWFGDVDQIPEILRVNNLLDDAGVPEGTGASTSLEWHADYSYVPTVGKESFLEAVKIPAVNPPQTCFCSQYSAFERLPEATKKLLRPLRAYHSITNYPAASAMNAMNQSAAEADEIRAGFKAKQKRNQQQGIKRTDIPVAEHPVVIRHPDTGREILYVSKGITRQILGLPEEESSDLLKELAAISTAPDYVYAHDWQQGDMVVFDTLGTLHRRDAWDPSAARVMRQLSSLWTPEAAAS